MNSGIFLPFVAVGPWVLPEDYCKKDPCSFNAEMFVSKVGNPCPTLGQLLASRILCALLVAEKQYEIARARFGTQSCSKCGRLLSIPRQLFIPWEVAVVFLPGASGNTESSSRWHHHFLNPHFVASQVLDTIVKLMMPIHYLRNFWRNRWCAPS